MAPLSFLKSDKSSSPSSSTPETPPSRYNPSRFLRRRPSTTAKTSVDSDSTTGPPTASTDSSLLDQQDAAPLHPHPLFWRKRSEQLSPKFTREWGDALVIIDAGEGGGDELPRARRPVTPPMYPTALSPPRRPIPRSPRSRSTSTSYPTPTHAQAPQSASMTVVDSLSAVRRSSPTSSQTAPSPIRSTVSSEWLKRKPSGSRRGNAVDGKKLDGAAPIRSIRAGSTDPESSSADSDGEVGARATRRRSKIGMADGAYEVEVLCVDRKEAGEMKWEVTIRNRLQRPPTSSPPAWDPSTTENGSSIDANGTGPPPSSPLQLSTTSSIAQAPGTANSINLSLSLDQPTGKLVFIAFPMDIHATPTRRRKEKDKGQAADASPRMSSTPLRPSTPPHAPDLGSSPVTPSSTKGATSAWPSPSKNGVGRSRSPVSASPREMFTPRRSPLMTAAQLDGGLYARGTVGGLNEEMEKGLSLGRRI